MSMYVAAPLHVAFNMLVQLGISIPHEASIICSCCPSTKLHNRKSWQYGMMSAAKSWSLPCIAQACKCCSIDWLFDCLQGSKWVTCKLMHAVCSLDHATLLSGGKSLVEVLDQGMKRLQACSTAGSSWKRWYWPDEHQGFNDAASFRYGQLDNASCRCCVSP